MYKMIYEDALKCAMEGEAVFIVGSGFSVDARNSLEETENKLWVGSQLAKKLAILTEMELDVQLDIVAQEYIDIYGEHRLVQYLRDHYTVNSYADYYKVFSKIKNLRVYSTNYDDLLEKVCTECGNKIKGYNIEQDIRKVQKNKMIMHLNGYVRDLIGENLPESFKLSHLSYNNTKFFNTPWYAYLIEELHSAKAIFIVGLSFSSDLDIRRIVSNEELKEKIFFIESEKLSNANRKFLNKYGRVLLCGVKNFCDDLSKVTLDNPDEKKEMYYKSFKKMPALNDVLKVEDRDVYDLFFKGKEKGGIYKKDENRKYESLVNRDKVNDVIDGLKNGHSFIIYSDLGNGKSIFINQIINLCPNIEFFFLKQNTNTKILNEIKHICTDKKEKVIICDPANLFLETIKKFADFDLAHIRFLFVLRASMYDNYYNSIYDVIDLMQNVKFMNPINLDELSDNELQELDQLILEYGFYGEHTGYSQPKRIRYLKSDCKSRFQNILLYLFESMHIIEKFVDSIGDLKTNSELRRILILAFVSGILELGLNMNDYKILLDINEAERIIKRSGNCGELLDVERGEIAVKSSIIAKELMMKTEIFSKNEVFQVLVSVMQKLDNLYLGSDKYKNVMINLVSCSYISYVFGFQMDSSKLIEYYEQVKELSFCRKNLFFWEQYAIVCVNLKQFDRAERYFKTAYSLAKQKGRVFSAYQIDNHYARYLLENQLYYRKTDNSVEIFIEAHRLLNKNSEVERSNKNSRYYKYRVARLYKDYYDAFAIKYSSSEKELFLCRCKEMYHSLLNYKNGLKEDEIRKDVKECESGLKYILASENDFIVNAQ